MLDITIAGAGPYGLSVASHLRGRKVPFRIFGQPMLFWRNMPPNLFLKSFGFATAIDNPDGLNFDAWCRERGLEDREPCSVQSFVDYGMWLQKRVVPSVESAAITSIRTAPGGFQLTLDTGEEVQSRRVVVALGLRYFRRIPAVLGEIPGSLCSHTSENGSYERFRGRDVVVLGAGASALEAAALLHEAGARPLLLARGPRVIFHSATPLKRSLYKRVTNPLSVVGEGRLGWMLQHFPQVPYFAPDALRVKLTRRYLGPSGSWWLKDRFEGKVPVRLRTEVLSARPDGDGVLLEVRGQDGNRNEIRAHHVVCGTGYEVNLDRLPMLDDSLRSRLARIEGAPRLNRNFESSVPGLYFVGALSMFSFGPLFRFVAGTYYTGPTLARHLARSAGPSSEPQPSRPSVAAVG